MKIYILLALFLALSLRSFSKPLNPKKIVYALNAGGNQNSKSALGFTYFSDRGSSSGRIADYGVNPEASGASLKYTRDPHIYFTERHDDKSFGYEYDLKKEGDYVLILKFAEMKFTEKNQRVFKLKFGEQIVRETIDVAGTVGRYAAYDEYVPFELRNGMIFYEGKICTGAYNMVNNKMSFELVKTQMDNPMIMGFVVFEGTLEESDYNEIPSMREDWEKRIKEENKKKEEEKLRKEYAKLKKREKVKVRNDQNEDFEDDFEDVVDFVQETDLLSKIFNMQNFLLISFAAGAFFYFLNTKKASSLKEAAQKTLLDANEKQENIEPPQKKESKKKR